MKQVQVLELVDGSDAMFDEADGSFDASDIEGDEETRTFASSDLDI
jgi:hypothetical protein